MRISKKTREQAALICAMSASGLDYACFTYDVADHVGMPIDHPARELAHRAIVHVEIARRSFGWSREYPAEAEALLRTGWSP